MKHGLSSTRLYSVWTGMKDRCYNPNSKNYKHYGGRGIIVCEEWRTDFLAFYNWALSSGYDEAAPRGQYTIERKDNDGPYSPDNCKWVTLAEQERNKRSNILVQVGDETMVLKQACEKLGLNYDAERKRSERRRQGTKLREDYLKAEETARCDRYRAIIQAKQEHPNLSQRKLAEITGYSVGMVNKALATLK